MKKLKIARRFSGIVISRNQQMCSSYEEPNFIILELEFTMKGIIERESVKIHLTDEHYRMIEGKVSFDAELAWDDLGFVGFRYLNELILPDGSIIPIIHWNDYQLNKYLETVELPVKKVRLGAFKTLIDVEQHLRKDSKFVSSYEKNDESKQKHFYDQMQNRINFYKRYEA